MLPRDVKTRWNSTYRLLTTALDYREAVDTITGDRRLGLRELELSEEEWTVLTQLRDVLKVSGSFDVWSLVWSKANWDKLREELLTAVSLSGMGNSPLLSLVDIRLRRWSTR